MVAYEGDRNLTGDGVKLNGFALGDRAHPSGNFFDSSISNLGTPVSGSTPNYKNQLGFDAAVLAVPAGVVANGATSARDRPLDGQRPLSARAWSISAPTSTRRRWCSRRR